VPPVTTPLHHGAPSRRAILAALLGVYLAWGATYVAIAIAVRTLPPLLTGGVRFFTAGALLFAVMRVRGERPPTPAEWRTTAIIGALLLGVGNGLVSLVARSVASSLIALIIALTPLFVSAFSFIVSRERPSPRALVAMALGLTGVFVLVGTPDRRSLASIGEIGMILGAILSWSFGSVLARRLPLPSSSAMSTAAQMLAGGSILIASGVLRGELGHIRPRHASFESLLALLYLVFIGSIVGFGAYAFLLKHTQPAVATSYAYVNPLIALVLGHTLAREPIDARTLVGAGIVVAAVMLLLLGNTKRA
jgi:drug/metabolite transporter (DMT)-like permease